MEYKWCAIDAEGDVGNKGLLGVAFYSDIQQSYETRPDEIRGSLRLHAEEGYTFLAHNAQYDLSVIFWQLKIPIKAIYYNGRFNRGSWEYDPEKQPAQLWDTLALSGGLSLAKLGQALGIEKYPTPHSILGRETYKYTWKCDKHDAWECEECYAVRDAEIAYEFVQSLTTTLSAWGVKPRRRINGLAVDVWRALDNPEPISIDSFVIRRLARAAYHGGRVETFKLGYIQPCFTADVCSMYPSVMLDNPYPDPKSMVYLKNPHLSHLNLDHEGVIDCDVTVPTMHVPPLPYSDRGLIKYPIGRFRGYWTIAEIRYAMGLGCKVNRIYQLATTPTKLYPFTNFIRTMWELRQEYERNSDPRSLFAKLLMNNLYGRLGASDAMLEKTIYPCDYNKRIEDQPKTEWYTQDGELYLTYEKETHFRTNWTNVCWAAHTTAYARIKLHGYLMMQGPSVVYCDTDSVFSTQPIIGLGEGLGKLRDPIQYRAAIIGAPKLYAVQDLNGTWRGKAKGVRKDAALKFLKEGTATYDQPIKPSSQGIRKIKAGTWVQVTKESHHVPHRRQPTNPAYLESEFGSSDTLPPITGPRV